MVKQPPYWLKVDTREQLPLMFTVTSGGSLLGVVTETLHTGDYWGAWENGNEIPICFERKTLGDLWKTLTVDYARFKKELERAREHGLKVVLIIEGSLTKVKEGYEYSKFAGPSMLKKIFTLWVKYDLTPVFCNNRREMGRFIQETFEAVVRNYEPERKEPDDENSEAQRLAHPIPRRKGAKRSV